jgi:two-component system response regulator MprA
VPAPARRDVRWQQPDDVHQGPGCLCEVRPDGSGREQRLTAPGRVLLVDDDHALREALARALTLEGYEVETAADGLEAVSTFVSSETDVVVLDVLMPNLDGLGACRLIRRQSRVPILMLTARDEVGDRVAGLEAGADDYLGKPFAVVELLARLRALLRRTGGGLDTLRYADLELDPREQRVRRGSRPIELTRMEFDLLAFLMRHPRQAIDRPTIFRAVWGYEPDHASNSVDVFIASLRRKTEAGGECRLITTVRGTGYALREAN